MTGGPKLYWPLSQDLNVEEELSKQQSADRGVDFLLSLSSWVKVHLQSIIPLYF